MMIWFLTANKKANIRKVMVPKFAILPMSVLTLLVPLFISLPSFADQISGFIQRRDQGIWLLLEPTKQSFLLRGRDYRVSHHIERLQHGDFLYGHGTLGSGKREILISDIDVVGLKDLLGHWIMWNGSPGEPIRRFYFSNFSEVTITSSQDDPNSKMDRERRYAYSIAPGSGNDWTIFFANPTSVAIGALQLGDIGGTERVVKIVTYSAGNQPPTTITLLPAEPHEP